MCQLRWAIGPRVFSGRLVGVVASVVVAGVLAANFNARIGGRLLCLPRISMAEIKTPFSQPTKPVTISDASPDIEIKPARIILRVEKGRAALWPFRPYRDYAVTGHMRPL